MTRPAGDAGSPWEGDDGSGGWGPPRPPGDPPSPSPARPVVPRGGSGIVITPDGCVLTNEHVIAGAERIVVRLHDGRRLDARVRGIDPDTDLAVVCVPAEGLPTAPFGDSDGVKAGQWAIAIGAPFGLEHTVTVGHISGTGRVIDMPHVRFQDFIQTDASINPGNSGGPLVDLDGKVVGVNSAILGVGTGVGFAIPASLAERVGRQLVADGKVVRPWLGLELQDLGAELADALGAPPGGGAVVLEVLPGGPAADSGLRPGDALVTLDGRPLRSPHDLANRIARGRIGQEVEVGYVRHGKRGRIRIATGPGPIPDVDWPDLRPQGDARPLGLHVAPALGRTSPLPEGGAGALVQRVDPGGLAAASGLLAGDVILSVGPRPVRSSDDVASALASAPRRHVALVVWREGTRKVMALERPTPEAGPGPASAPRH
ncbi:trypsin-like peptidase domain-containing protein [Myxococcota bacterium]|nr:trypsin-like peptidase domain-containing protein [Myxococcota bacterium]